MTKLSFFKHPIDLAQKNAYKQSRRRFIGRRAFDESGLISETFFYCRDINPMSEIGPENK